MLVCSQLLFESSKSSSPVTRGEVGGGLGGYIARPLGFLGGAWGGAALFDDDPVKASIAGAIGSGIGSSVAGQLGKFIGRKVIADPDKPADFQNAAHRIGYLARPRTSTYGAVGDLASPWLTNIGSNIYNAASENGAARLGYQGAGKIGNLIFGPLTGIVGPDKVAKNK